MTDAARTRTLRVALNGRFVATVVRRGRDNRTDTVTLTYDSDANLALTPALPVQVKPHRGTPVLAFLAGLLPDAEAVRLRWANQFGVPDQSVDLLAHMGRECAGAVQFVPEGHEHLLEAGQMEYVPLSEAQIGERLRTLRTPEGQPSWTVHDEHWSLGGAQAKFALARIDGQWCEASGAAPTTHIFKPGIGAMKHQAAVEFATMRASRALGLPTASVNVQVFDAEPTLVVERFDRRPPGDASSDGAIRRIHQVDLCQAAGVMPDRKYERTPGSPTARQLATLLRRTSTRPDDDVRTFSDALLFNYLAECPDGHAKNHALLLSRTQVRLAPLYDLATGAPYDKTAADTTSAFAIGGVRRFGEAYAKNWIAHAKDFGLEADERLERVRRLATDIPDAFREAFHDPEVNDLESGLSALLWTRMSSGPGRIGERCATVLKRLG